MLFLKMMQETKREDALPKGYRWGDLTKREGEDLLTHYRALLLKLGTEGKGMCATSSPTPRPHYASLLT